MGFSSEALDTIKMVKQAGNKVADIVFEGALSVKRKEVLKVLQELEDNGEAVGVLRLGYVTKDRQLRVIEIPVGKLPKEEKGKLDKLV